MSGRHFYSRPRGRRDKLHHILHERASVDPLRLRLRPPGAGILKDAIDQRFHPVNAPAQHLHLGLALARQRGPEIFFDPLGKIGDAAQRRLEIVRRDVRELVELLIAARQRLDELLRCSLRNLGGHEGLLCATFFRGKFFGLLTELSRLLLDHRPLLLAVDHIPSD